MVCSGEPVTAPTRVRVTTNEYQHEFPASVYSMTLSWGTQSQHLYPPEPLGLKSHVKSFPSGIEPLLTLTMFVPGGRAAVGREGLTSSVLCILV